MVTDKTFEQLRDHIRVTLLRIRYELAALKVYWTCKRAAALVRKAGFNPA